MYVKCLYWKIRCLLMISGRNSVTYWKEKRRCAKMIVLELIGLFFRILISFLFQMIGLFLSFLLGISGLVSRLWMLLLFATVCFHACGLDQGTINMFSDKFALIAYIVITIIVLFAQTILGWLVSLCFCISEYAMMF